MEASRALAEFPGATSLYLLAPMGAVSLHLEAVVPFATVSFFHNNSVKYGTFIGG